MTQFILDALPFITFTAIGAFTPGPNNVMVAASGVNGILEIAFTG